MRPEGAEKHRQQHGQPVLLLALVHDDHHRAAQPGELREHLLQVVVVDAQEVRVGAGRLRRRVCCGAVAASERRRVALLRGRSRRAGPALRIAAARACDAPLAPEPHAATRRLVLQGADGVVFVGDSQLSEARANGEFWQGMRQHISDNNIEPDTLPTVIQFNKRDLSNIRTDDELSAIAAKSNEPLFKAVAIRGEGVLETLHGLLQMLFVDLNRKHDFERKFHISSHEFLNGVFGAARNQP